MYHRGTSSKSVDTTLYYYYTTTIQCNDSSWRDHRRLREIDLLPLRAMEVTFGDEMKRIASAPAAHFKTMLRLLSGGFHLDQASQLVVLRSKIPGAVLTTDDYNMCVFAPLHVLGLLHAQGSSDTKSCCSHAVLAV